MYGERGRYRLAMPLSGEGRYGEGGRVRGGRVRGGGKVRGVEGGVR